MRAARRVSESGYYHVVVRGNGKQRLFENDEDRRFFLKLLREYAHACEIDIIAWCLMDNHVHLIFCDCAGRLSEAMGKMAMRYARWFNARSGHVGHVFQGRFKSSPIERDQYLLEAVRYVHNNPSKAGVCDAEDYPWSSYHEYAGTPEYAKTEVVLDMLGGPEGFSQFCREDPSVEYLFVEGVRIPDEEAGNVAGRVLGDVGFSEVKSLSREKRDELLRELRASRLSVRQIERLTGIGAKTITRATT